MSAARYEQQADKHDEGGAAKTDERKQVADGKPKRIAGAHENDDRTGQRQRDPEEFRSRSNSASTRRRP